MDCGAALPSYATVGWLHHVDAGTSGIGTTRTFRHVRAMSAIGGISDILVAQHAYPLSYEAVRSATGLIWYLLLAASGETGADQLEPKDFDLPSRAVTTEHPSNGDREPILFGQFVRLFVSVVGPRRRADEIGARKGSIGSEAPGP